MHKLPELPFSPDSLEPWISRETIDYHYGKHHATYVNKLNELIQDTELETLELEAVVCASADSKGKPSPVFNNAAQAWNHAFYWQCLTPKTESPSGDLAERLIRDFGSVETFQEKFTNAAVGNFGSGWTWLVAKPDGSLAIINTSNAATPLTGEDIPLLTCDVWEHAYYIDYRNVRADYVQGFWKHVNWAFVATQLSRLDATENAA